MSNENQIKTESTGGSLLIRLPPVLTEEIRPTLDQEVSGWLLEPLNLFVFDLTGVQQLSRDLYPIFAKLARTLQKNNKHIFAINCVEDLRRQISNDGMANVFNFVKSTDEAYERAGLKTKKAVKLDSNIINPFIDAAINTFEVQCSTPVKPGKAALYSPNIVPPVDIAGVISMTCADFDGSITIGFPQATFLSIYKNMIGETHESISDEVKDAAGELLNIIYGQAKTALTLKGYSMVRAIPTILAGNNIQVHNNANRAQVVVPFTSGAGAFFITISIGSN